MEIPKSIVRFAEVVEESGRPQPVVLWTDPKRDPSLQAAVRANRVMTVRQETVGTQKDFGVVGFHRVAYASYWVFPKSLKRFERKRIIGIKYDLLNVPKPEHPVKLAAESVKKAQHVEKAVKKAARKPPPEPQLAKAKSEPHRYRVLIRSIATAEYAREVEANTAKEAEELALRMVAKERVEFPPQEIAHRVTGVRRL